MENKEKSLERDRLEEALRESEIRYRTLYDSSADAIMIVIPEKGFIAGNKTAVEIFGCKDEKEFIGQSPATMSPEFQPDGRPSLIKSQEMMALAIEKGSHLFEWKHRRINGEEFFATVLLTRFELHGQRFLQATVRDITKQKTTEEMLMETLEEWDKTFNSISDLIFIADKDNNIIKVNKAFADFFKKPPEELTGKKCYNLLHGLKSPWPACPLEKTKQDLQPHIEEVDDAHIGVPLLVTTSPILNAGGELTGIVHIARDISGIKKSEMEMKKKIGDLERFQRITVDRELKMKELKTKIADLEARLGAGS